jgi:AcrR family transcriptional regulator
MARPRDQNVTDAAHEATIRLLGEVGYAGLTMERVAREAGVGKPALYRRYRDKAQLVVGAILATELGPIEDVDLGDSREELRLAAEGLPVDAITYTGLIGGLMAEHQRHPELIETFRTALLLPRRAVVVSLIERGQARGEIRRDVDPVMALDMLGGQLLARAFAGADTGAEWREGAFSHWWELVSTTNG